MIRHDWERPIDRAETADACLESIAQLVSACKDMHSITANEFSQLLGLVRSQLRGSLDEMLQEARPEAGRPLDATTAGRA
ncbi:MAG: hypothetical protein HQL37_09480 [Alphaproteobacteria bacterium]|nr:hypothetical protein [Alphaproteobacteria bacterium]